MSTDFDVPMAEAKNFIRVSTNYYKDVHRLVVSVGPIEKKDRMISFRLMSGKSYVWEQMKRKNAKRIDAVHAEVVAQIAARSGRIWDAVEDVARAEKLTIPEA